MTDARLPLARRLRYALETGLVYVLYSFFHALPVETASSLGGKIARRFGPRLRSSAVARRNLVLAFPSLGAAEREKIVAGMWDNLGRVMAEYAHLRRLQNRVEIAGAEHLENVRDSGRPAIFFGGHLANWEVGTVAAKDAGLDMHLVYRRPNNPGAGWLLRHARGAGASAQIAKGAEGARGMLAVLKNNGALAVLMDQKLNEGMAVPFFGRDAMTATAVASFALRFEKCPVYPVRVERLGGCRFKMTICPALDIRRSGDKERDMLAILTEINRHLESWIRARPEQWLWIHRRWPDDMN